MHIRKINICKAALKHIISDGILYNIYREIKSWFTKRHRDSMVFMLMEWGLDLHLYFLRSGVIEYSGVQNRCFISYGR